MGNFRMWLARFMRGRYGFDQLGQALGTAAVVVFIVCLLLDVVARHLLVALFYVFNALNMVAWALIVFELYRILSRNVDKRRGENERYLQWRANRMGKRGNRARKGGSGTSGSRDMQQGNYLYLNCPACGQDMRVPRGRGKIDVMCPKCGQHTITIS